MSNEFLPAILVFIIIALVVGLIILVGAKRTAGGRLKITRRTFMYSIAIPVVLGMAFLGIGAFLEWHHTPEFCGEMCHSMNPYYDKYANPENNSMLIVHPDEHVTCADCHMGPGWSGFFGSFLVVPWEVTSETFNLYTPGELHADVPDDWCTKCHDGGRAGKPGDVFAPGNVSVDPHDLSGMCTDCHETHQGGLGMSEEACNVCHGLNLPDWATSIQRHDDTTGNDCMACHDRAHPEEARIQWEEMPEVVNMEFCADCHQPSYDFYNTSATEDSLELYGDCTDCHVEHLESTVPHLVTGDLSECDNCHPRAGVRGGIHDRNGVDYLDAPGVEGDLCEPCHPDPYDDLFSKHSDRECTDCHMSHLRVMVEFSNCDSPCHDVPEDHDEETAGCAKSPCHGEGWYH